MGSNTSQEEEKPLLSGSEEIPLVFEELRLVLIGNHSAGKNTIGNAILRKKVFTFWTSLKKETVEKTQTVSGSQIHLARTPGWNRNLNKSVKIRNEIVYCLHSSCSAGLHAVLLVINVTSELPDSNIRTLESLLTVQLWDHTIIIFFSGGKLEQHWSIEDYIRRNQLQTLIDKCGQRYFVIHKNDTSQILETIEEHIIRKNSTSCLELSSQAKVADKISNLGHLVARIKSKIASISDFRQNLKGAQNDLSIQKLLDSKDAEIKRLQTLLEVKETEIESLRARAQDPVLSIKTLTNDLQREKAENKALKKEVETRDAKIEELEKEVQMWQDQERERRRLEDQDATAHANYCSELSVMSGCQDASVLSRRRCEIQLEELPSRGAALHNWSDTLLDILNMLSDDELEDMKYRISWNYKFSMKRNFKRAELADQMLKQWGEQQSILNTRELLKKIPRNDDAMKELIEPFLIMIDKTW